MGECHCTGHHQQRGQDFWATSRDMLLFTHEPELCRQWPLSLHAGAPDTCLAYMHTPTGCYLSLGITMIWCRADASCLSAHQASLMHAPGSTCTQAFLVAASIPTASPLCTLLTDVHDINHLAGLWQGSRRDRAVQKRGGSAPQPTDQETGDAQALARQGSRRVCHSPENVPPSLSLL